MRTLEVTREFRNRAKELAEKSAIPEVQVRLRLLADHYQRELDKLERSASASIVPESDSSVEASEKVAQLN